MLASNPSTRDTQYCGASRPWTEALHQMTGEDRIDGAALREYFAPLEAWLEEQLRGEARGWE